MRGMVRYLCCTVSQKWTKWQRLTGLWVWRSHTCLTGPQVIKEFYAMGPVWACVHEWLGLTVESPELKVLLLCVYGRTAWKQVVLASVRLFCLNFSQNWNYSRLTRSRGSEPASTKAGYTQSGVTPLLICLCFSCFDTWMPACWGRSCPKPHWSWDEILSGRLRENTCESLLRVLSAYKKHEPWSHEGKIRLKKNWYRLYLKSNIPTDIPMLWLSEKDSVTVTLPTCSCF